MWRPQKAKGMALAWAGFAQQGELCAGTGTTSGSPRCSVGAQVRAGGDASKHSPARPCVKRFFLVERNFKCIHVKIVVRSAHCVLRRECTAAAALQVIGVIVW